MHAIELSAYQQRPLPLHGQRLQLSSKFLFQWRSRIFRGWLPLHLIRFLSIFWIGSEKAFASHPCTGMFAKNRFCCFLFPTNALGSFFVFSKARRNVKKHQLSRVTLHGRVKKNVKFSNHSSLKNALLFEVAYPFYYVWFAPGWHTKKQVYIKCKNLVCLSICNELLKCSQCTR